jgi:hypothetical protein
MSLPYENATSGDRALVEVQKMLAKWGCASFGTAQDVERGVTIVSFRWRERIVHLEASWKGYAQALKRSGWKRDDECIEQAKTAVCSVLRDWCKAQITAIECGVLSFEAAFMPHMLLKDGRRALDAAQAANLLPAPEEPSNVRLVK